MSVNDRKSRKQEKHEMLVTFMTHAIKPEPKVTVADRLLQFRERLHKVSGTWLFSIAKVFRASERLSEGMPAGR